MNAADVLLFTSFWEGSPNVVKEAMACNLPIVSVRVGDVPEVIGNAHNCYLADYDPADLAAKVKCVLASGERSNGRQFVEHLRVENVARKLNDIYVDVLKR